MILIGIDVGGTFTDLCMFDADGSGVQIAKTSTTVPDPSAGVLNGLALLGIDDPHRVEVLQHGTTIVTNALIERRGVKTGLLTTEGFRDVLEIMRTDRERSYDLAWVRPEPIVPRYLRREVRERVGPAGDILVPLDEGGAVSSAAALVQAGCEAIAVVLLHSDINDYHEREVERLIRATWPDLRVYLSSQVDPQYREYERSCTTALTAFVGPIVARYFDNLEHGLEANGFDPNRLNVMQSSGGTIRPSQAVARAGNLFGSGPAAGVVGAIECARQVGLMNIVTMDMGGTSCDVSLALDGRVAVAAAQEVAFSMPLRIPALDVVSIGAGGGSISYLDSGGGLQVGPESAGASPGPACYGRGGLRPTVTDANAVLGRLGAETIAGGAVAINGTAAERAIREIAEPLGLSPEEAALGVIRIATAKMASAIREVSIERGLDPRDFTLVAFGGAGPLHAVDVAAELEIPTVLIPFSPGVLSAFGCMISDLRFDFLRSAFGLLSDERVARMCAAAQEMKTEASDLMRAQGVDGRTIAFSITADMRYVGQVHEVTTPLPEDFDQRPVADIVECFHTEHARLYGEPFPGHHIEVVSVRLTARAPTPKPDLTFEESIGDRKPTPRMQRPVVFAGGYADAAIYDRTDLTVGSELVGPAVIEAEDTTLLIPPTHRARVERNGSLLLMEIV